MGIFYKMKTSSGKILYGTQWEQLFQIRPDEMSTILCGGTGNTYSRPRTLLKDDVDDKKYRNSKVNTFCFLFFFAKLSEEDAVNGCASATSS